MLGGGGHMTTTDERQDRSTDELEDDGFEAVVDLVDTDPVPLVEVDDDADYEQRAAEHLGEDDPHDETDVLPGVELVEDGA